jgi:TonB family protein
MVIALAALPARAQTTPQASAPKDPEAAAMKVLAGDVAQAVKKAHLKNLLVMDFQGPDKKYSLLGRKLADDLSAALAVDPAIGLIDRKQFAEFVSREGLLIPEANQPDPANWIANQLSAKSFVIGNIEETGNDFILHITIYDSPKPRNVQDLKTAFSKTADLSSLAGRALDATGDDQRNRDHKLSSLPHSGQHGYSFPHCEYCPPPEFSTEARRHKTGGTAILIADVDETGRITNAAMLQGLFYGLNEKAVEGVKQWRMKPTAGPDGSPVAVQQVIEVSFHLY